MSSVSCISQTTPSEQSLCIDGGNAHCATKKCPQKEQILPQLLGLSASHDHIKSSGLAMRAVPL